MPTYRTIDRALGGTAEAEIVVSRSRFLARVSRVEDEGSAREFMARLRSIDHDARHHCTAFVIGPDGSLRRSNDDGEPSGTAGRPMLEVISGREVSDVVAVVTRWFGGILLGTGGLARAYAEATTAAVGRREILDKAPGRCRWLAGRTVRHYLRCPRRSRSSIGLSVEWSVINPARSTRAGPGWRLTGRPRVHGC